MGAFANAADGRRAHGRGSRWVIVLAGGTGERMRPIIRQWLKEDRPKQYCAFVGGRSMLQHTLDRAAALAPREQIVLVIGRGQEEYLAESVRPRSAGIVMRQPNDCGTAAAIFGAAAHITERDPGATIVVFPSDHFVHPEGVFLERVARACAAVELSRERIALLAALPRRPETDYGWIVPAEGPESSEAAAEAGDFWRIKSFHEKPGPRKAEELCRQGGLWNTMVLACKARALWALGERFLPEMAGAFDVFRRVLRAVQIGEVGPEHAPIALTHLYSRLRPADFSREVLERASPWSWVFPLHGVDWCDWGRPERIVESLRQLGLSPAFACGGNREPNARGSWRLAGDPMAAKCA